MTVFRARAYAYAQARLQARHGQRPDEITWRRLGAIRDLGHFLQVARTTVLRPWVLSISTHTPIHEVEYTLRTQFRRYVETVARWQPAPWRPAVAWAARLIDLPALQHLLSGEAVPAWMREDPELQRFTAQGLEDRLAALAECDCFPLVRAVRAGTPLPRAWLDHWRALWPPAAPTLTRPLTQLAARIERYRALAAVASATAGAGRERLEHDLRRLFRRHTQQPATAFVHLALVALDLERLRGMLLRRLLFATVPAEENAA